MRRMYSEKQVQEIIKERVESGELENAKPLYFHALIFVDSSNQQVMSCTIIDNNSTPYDIDSCIAHIVSWGDNARLLCLGGNLRTLNSGSSFTPSNAIVKNEEIFLIGLDNSGVYHSDTANSIKLNKTNFPTLIDEVDKLN